MNTKPVDVMAVRSLSPAFWYVCNTARAKEDKSRGMVAGPFATADEARAALARIGGAK